MLLDLIVEIHYVQDVKKLSLVLMETLDLYIKDGSGIHLYPVVILDIFCQTNLVFILDIHELLLSPGVVSIYLKLLHLVQIGDPLGSDVIRYPLCQKGIAMEQKSPLSDAVGLVIELGRIHIIKVLKGLLFKYLRMKCSHAVYGKAGCDCQMSHLDLAVLDDGHTCLFALISGELPLDIQAEAAVDLLNDVVNSGKES